MWERFAVKLATSLLKRADLSIESRNILAIHILDRLGALPIADTITFSESDEVLVNGYPLDKENERKLRFAARDLLQNPAKEFVYQQLLKTAVNHGIFQAESEKQVFWSRAAIWYAQHERELLSKLAGNALLSSGD